MRTDRLLHMVLETDPFKRDELYMEFIRAGFLVGSGRNELRGLGMTPEEQKNFDAQTGLIRKIEAAQDQVIDLVAYERFDEARLSLVTQAVPMREQLNVLLAGLRDAVQNANNAALTETRKAYQHSLLITLISGSAATLLGIILGWFTMSRIIASRHRIQQQVSELETSRAALQIEATHDPLTGLANRRLFYDRLEQALLRAKRYRYKVGVLFVDLDRFKSVNDHHGHHIGDALLMEVARRLGKSVRESDTVARSGGDEFMIVLDKLHDLHDCLAIVRQIEDTLSGEIDLHGLKLKLSASVGHALYPDNGNSEDELVRAADASMYDIKTSSQKQAL